MKATREGRHEGVRSERWVQGIRELARNRGDGEAVWRRAVALTRELNLAPWVGLAVAEGLISLEDASLLDRAARCADLQAAVLDKRKGVNELRHSMPYAPYLLAVELVDLLGRANWDLRKVTAVTKGLLGQKLPAGAGGTQGPVRTKSLEEYAAAVKRVRALVERTGCTLRMALDVEAGLLSESYVRQYLQQRRRLVQEERNAQTPRREGRPSGARAAAAGHAGERPPPRRGPGPAYDSRRRTGA